MATLLVGASKGASCRSPVVVMKAPEEGTRSQLVGPRLRPDPNATTALRRHRSKVDPYAVLGIDLFASDAELVRAFRRLALLHHPDRNGGSAESAVRFREIKAAYDTLRARRPPTPAAAQPPRQPGPTSNSRALDPEPVAQVRRRLEALEAAIRAVLAAPSQSNIAAVVDAARWARLDVNTSLAMKGHVADLRDEHWAQKTFTTREQAMATLREFIAHPIARLDLVGMRSLRARLTGVLAVSRGVNEAT